MFKNFLCIQIYMYRLSNVILITRYEDIVRNTRLLHIHDAIARLFDGLVSIYILKVITETCLYNFDPLKPHFYTVHKHRL